MGLFKKRDDLPEIPAAPNLAELNFSFKGSTTNLPMPNGGDSRDLSNREVIKSAIEDSSEKMGDGGTPESLPEIPEEKIVINEPKMRIPEISIPTLKQVESLRIQEPPMEPSIKDKSKDIKTDSAIFVKIEKINSAQKDLEETQDCIERISSLLKNLNYAKKEEDEEMRALNEDVEKIKEKIGDIDSKIFNKI
jgi:hypothetical protein